MTPEFSRIVDRHQIAAAPLAIAATEKERAALAARFGLVRIDRLETTVTLIADGDTVDAKGTLHAAWVQSCAISGEDLPQQTNEPISLRFVPGGENHGTEEEIELSASDHARDDIHYTGTGFDLGEAVAQSLALAVDPFAAGPGAESARQSAGLAGEGPSGPFAALSGLKLGK